jgi:hypothetical protein
MSAQPSSSIPRTELNAVINTWKLQQPDGDDDYNRGVRDGINKVLDHIREVLKNA